MFGRCAICGRRLTNPVSVARGIGPICAGKTSKGGEGHETEARTFGLSKLRLDPERDYFLLLDIRKYGLQLVRRRDGAIAYNVPHYCVHHSPTGFEWGYSGSGPADLALNAVEHVLHLMGYKGQRMTNLFEGSCFRATWRLHHPFKDEFIAKVSRSKGGTIPYQEMVDWIQERQDVLDEYAQKIA